MRLLIFCFLVGLTSINGCISTHKARRAAFNVGTTGSAILLTAYPGPKVKVAVADFDIKVAKTSGEIGPGLREMFVAALVNSGRFLVVERGTAAGELIVTAAVTEFEPLASGGRGGVGGGGGVNSGVLGGFLGAGLNRAHMALDIRLVDTVVSQVKFTTKVQGQATDISGSLMGGLFGERGLARELSGYANTPMEKAIRMCIAEAVRYLSEVTPQEYYKY